MSGNIHFTATGDASDFKKMMRDVREEIRDTEGSVDDLKGRLSDAVGDRDLFGLKEAVAEGKGELESLGKSIGKIEDIINQLPAGSSEHKGMLDVLTQMKGKYAELESTLGHAEKAMTILRGTMIRTAASIGVVTALAAGLVIAVRAVTKECRETKRAIEAGFGAVQGQTAQWLTDFYKAQALWKSAQGDVDKLNGYLETHRDILEASGIAINDINEGDKVFIENSDAMVDAIKKRAVAMAFEQAASVAAQKAAEEYLDAEEKVAKRENRNSTNMFQQAWNVIRFGRYQNGEMSEEAQQYFAGKYEKWRGKADSKASFWVGITQKMSESGITAMQEYEKALEALGLKTAGGTKNEKDYKAALDDTIARLEKYAALMDRINKLWEDQARARAKMEADVQNQIEQAKISAMQDGYEKEQAQREFNQRRELEAIQQSKEDYIRAYRERAKAIWDAEEEAIAQQDKGYIKRKFDPSTVLPDTSAFDVLYKTIRDRQESDLINPLLAQYQSFEDKQKEIMERGSAEISALLAKGYKDQARQRREAMKAELGQLKDQYDETFKLIFKDPAMMNIVEITNAIRLAEEKIDELSATPESQKANIQYIEALRQAIERLKGASSDFSFQGVLKRLFGDSNGKDTTLAERFKAIGEAWNNMSADQKWQAIGGAVKGIADGLKKAAEYMNRVAEVSGDGRLKESAEQLGAVAQNFAAAGGGAATGGWIGAIVGGASDMISQTVQAISEAGLLEAQAAKNAEDWARALRNVGVEMDATAYESPFGERNLAKGREAMRSSAEAAKRYAEEMAAINRKYSEQEIDMLIYGGATSAGINTFLNPLGWIGGKNTISNEFKAYQDAISKGYDGLQRMLVKTKDRSGWANFWGAQDEYTALADLYPELFKNGELVIENAKKLLETNNALDDSQKEQIRNLVELKEKYDEAMDAVDDSISSVFNSLGEEITDIIWDSVVNGGEDAWSKFGEIGNKYIAALGKELLKEMVISEYLEQFRGQMRAAYGLGDATATQQAMRDIVQSIFGGMQTMFEVGTAVAEEWNAWATEHGFDLSETTEKGRTAVAKAMTSVSQESWDVVDGKITNMMMRLLDIDDRFAFVQDVQYRMYEVVSDIGEHTKNLEGMRNDIKSMRSDIEDIRTRGIKMQQI